MRQFRPHPLDEGAAPAWASGWGEDQFGVFVTFGVGAVEQRMQWIPPGAFLMGSPESEAGRDVDEAQHGVTLSQGYWLADTPCTQALWEGVVGSNPSYFPSPDRPVEQVSWDQVQEFLAALGERVPGLKPRLPTEAEWEYACHAGTTSATYAGDLEVRGLNDAPVLHEIAWYGGNSGLDFELEEGWASTGWREKQFEHEKAGTRRVAGKEPNAWGLYDMLGNVWEWCQDWYGPYGRDDERDPSGPEEGTGRVVRGGSWIDDARNVRAASRSRDAPASRDFNLGFRLARGQERSSR